MRLRREQHFTRKEPECLERKRSGDREREGGSLSRNRKMFQLCLVDSTVWHPREQRDVRCTLLQDGRAMGEVKKRFFRILFWTKRILSCDDGIERIYWSGRSRMYFITMPLGLAVVARGKAFHRVSHAHAALFVTAGEKARSSLVAGLPASARRHSCRWSRSQNR